MYSHYEKIAVKLAAIFIVNMNVHLPYRFVLIPISKYLLKITCLQPWHAFNLIILPWLVVIRVVFMLPNYIIVNKQLSIF
jgi:hypothetical protein